MIRTVISHRLHGKTKEKHRLTDLTAIKQAVTNARQQFHQAPRRCEMRIIFRSRLISRPTSAAVAVVTAQGDIISSGDADYRFAIESISKVCTLALALEDIGLQAVQDQIGADPPAAV